MKTKKHTTVYFDMDIRRAKRLKAAAQNRSVSKMVNDAVKVTLAEDVEDLAAFAERKKEHNLSFESFAQSLKRRGRI